jgi:hypothetical protein
MHLWRHAANMTARQTTVRQPVRRTSMLQTPKPLVSKIRETFPESGEQPSKERFA